MSREPSRIEAAEFERLVYDHMTSDSFRFTVEEIAAGFVRLRLDYHDLHLRPGGTISGPVMFTLADTALYALVMSVAGLVPLAVTSDMTLRFLRKPKPADLIAEGRLLKARGRNLVGEVVLYSDGDDDPVTHVTGTYALPRRGTQ